MQALEERALELEGLLLQRDWDRIREEARARYAGLLWSACLGKVEVGGSVRERVSLVEVDPGQEVLPCFELRGWMTWARKEHSPSPGAILKMVDCRG